MRDEKAWQNRKTLSRRQFMARTGGTLGAVATGALAGPRRASAQTPAQTRIRMGFITSDHYSPCYVAREKHWFEEGGIQPDSKSLVAGAPLVEGLASKNLDMGWMG